MIGISIAAQVAFDQAVSALERITRQVGQGITPDITLENNMRMISPENMNRIKTTKGLF